MIVVRSIPVIVVRWIPVIVVRWETQGMPVGVV